MYAILVFACVLAATNAAPGLIGAPLAVAPAPLAVSGPLLTKTIVAAPAPIAIQTPVVTRTIISSPPALAIAPQPILTKSIIAAPAVAPLPLGIGLSKSIIAGPAIAASRNHPRFIRTLESDSVHQEFLNRCSHILRNWPGSRKS